MDDRLLEGIYFSAWVTALSGVPVAFLRIPKALDRAALVLLNLTLFLVGYYEYCAWDSLPGGISDKSHLLSVFEAAGVVAFLFCVTLAVGAEVFVGPGGIIGRRVFRAAVACFFVYASTAALYWVALYVLDRNDELGAFKAMREVPIWKTFAASPLAGTLWTEGLYIPAAAISLRIVLRPNSTLPYNRNGLWTTAAWLSLVPFLYGLIGPVEGRMRWLFPVILGVHVVVLASPLRSTIRARTVP